MDFSEKMKNAGQFCHFAGRKMKYENYYFLINGQNIISD